MAELAACLQRGRRSRAGVPFLGSTVMVYISSPSSWTMRKEIQQLWESFSLHCLLTSVNSLAIRMLGQAWEQFFSKGPLRKALHSTQELQNMWPQLTSAGAEALSPGFGCGWALPKHRQGLPAPAQEMVGSPLPPMPSLHVSLTHICCRARGRQGTPGRRGAGIPPGIGTGCSGRSHGGCTHCHGCSSSHPSTSCTGRHSPGSWVCTCTPHSRISRGLQGKTFQTRILQRSRSPSLCLCLESPTHPTLSMTPSMGWSRRSCRLVRWDPGPPNSPTWILAGKGRICLGI